MNEGYRHELKYIISTADAKLLKLRLPHFMERDPHAGPSGCYTIRSLYFDDLAHSAFYEKVDGINIRSKYRIRMYNYRTDVFKLEKKEKLGNLTRKTAQTLTLRQAADLQRLRLRRETDREDLLAEVEMKIRSGSLRPMVLVDYDRTPFVCRSGNTRITLDENLRTKPYQADLTASPGAMIPVLEKGQVILEVKFDDFLPGYLADILRDIPKAPQAISKFALCMNLM